MSLRRALAVAASATALGAVAPALLSAAPAAAATTDACVTGKATFLDKDGVTHPATRLQVQAWDRDSGTPDDLLATGRAAADGSYKLCFDNDDGVANIGQDVYVKFITENGRWRVQKPGGPAYVTTDEGPDNVTDGSTTPLGTTQPSSTDMGSWRVYDYVNDAWEFVPHGPSDCWDAQDTTCRKRIVLNWPVSTGVTGYHADTDQVDLQAVDKDFADVVVHELGHAIMDDVYEDAADYEATDCTGHQIERVKSKACAWDEGFADWFALVVNKDPVFSQAGGDSNFETPHWNTDLWDDGDAVEGRVAGALLDIADSALAASDTWDRSTEGPDKIWTTFLRSGDPGHFEFRQPIRSFEQFWNYRAWDQFDRSATGALATVYQNAIDYGYREPLGDYASLIRPVPIPTRKYAFTANTGYWSAVALRPDADYDLQLFDDATGVMLNWGPQPNQKIEFIAIDSNAGRRSIPHAYEARVVNRSSTAEVTQAPYAIELAQGAQTLGVGSSQTINMQANDVVAVRDLRLETGQTATITVTPNNGQNPEMFLMASNPNNSGSWTPSRGTALASADTQGAGVAETFTVTASTTAYYGFVLLQKKGSPSGSYTVTVS